MCLRLRVVVCFVSLFAWLVIVFVCLLRGDSFVCFSKLLMGGCDFVLYVTVVVVVIS